MEKQVVLTHTPAGQAILGGMLLAKNGSRYRAAKNSQVVQVYHAGFGFWKNSHLLKDEWEALDGAIVRAARTRLRLVSDLAAAGLTHRLGGIGTMISQYNAASEMTRARISMDGRSQGENDRVDYSITGIPVPVIFKPYHFGSRELASSRNSGDQIETGHAEAAARVVVEELEEMAINGASNFQFNGTLIYGITNHPNRNTGSGSDWGTAANVITTVAAMIAAAVADNHYGPYVLYAARTQYNEAKNTFFTDGSGDTPYDRVMRMDGITGFYALDGLDAGECVLVQMDSEVIDLAFVPGFGFGTPGDPTGVAPVNGVTNLEWMSGDGMTSYHKALTIAVVRVKSRYDGKSGIVHYTGI